MIPNSGIIVSETEPTEQNRKKIWFDQSKKEIHVKNENGEYEVFYKNEDTGWITISEELNCKYRRINNNVNIVISCFENQTIAEYGKLEIGNLPQECIPSTYLNNSLSAKDANNVHLNGIQLVIETDGSLYIQNWTGSPITTGAITGVVTYLVD